MRRAVLISFTLGACSPTPPPAATAVAPAAAPSTAPPAVVDAAAPRSAFDTCIAPHASPTLSACPPEAPAFDPAPVFREIDRVQQVSWRDLKGQRARGEAPVREELNPDERAAVASLFKLSCLFARPSDTWPRGEIGRAESVWAGAGRFHFQRRRYDEAAAWYRPCAISTRFGVGLARVRMECAEFAIDSLRALGARPGCAEAAKEIARSIEKEYCDPVRAEEPTARACAKTLDPARPSRAD